MKDFSESMAWLARLDGGLVIGHGPFERRSAPPDEGVAFFVQDFGMRDPMPWQIPSHFERTTIAAMASRTLRPATQVIDWQPPDPAPFSAVFQEVMGALDCGVFEKTVPVVTETGTTREPPGASLIAAMIRQAAPLYSYGWVRTGAGFAGATPELLFALHGNRLETMALAGTAKSEDREVFAVDDKEIREHEFVARTVVEKLLGLGRVERRNREILDLGSLAHFLTTIALDLTLPLSPLEFLTRLHPTPALGPLPRNPQTLAMLLDWRNRLGCPKEFGAPFGLWDEGRFDAVVAIRGVWWDGGTVALPAGCGVIQASRLVNEWRELRLKRDAVKRLIAPF